MYIDVEFKARTDGVFRQKLIDLSTRMSVLHEKAQHEDTAADEYNATLQQFLDTCNGNLAFLAPYYFPKYPRSKPLSFAAYPFAFQMLQVNVGGFTVIKGSRQIAKSTSLAFRQILLPRMIERFRSLYIAPRSQHLETYATKLQEMSKAYRFYKPDHKLRQNLHYKEYSNGSAVELAYVLTNASVVRGKSTDELVYDEFQDFEPDLEVEVDQIQRASPTPITIYAGTSLTTESALEAKWAKSSQGEWVVKCRGCNQYNIPLLEHDVLKMVQKDGPSCCKCGKLLNILEGKTIHAYPDRVMEKKLGFHVPQIFVPAVVYNPYRWKEIYDRVTSGNNLDKVLQEILGLATEQGRREITRKDLEAICTLGKDTESYRQKARKGDYAFVLSACDWGGSDYVPAEHIKVSTTVNVIGGVRPNGMIDLIKYRRHGGMDYEDISNIILKDYFDYNCKGLATDYGVGAVYNSKLRLAIPTEQHLIFNYVGPTNPLIDEPNGPHIENQWSLNKTESLTMTMNELKTTPFHAGRIHSISWDFASEFLLDCLNVYRAVAETAGGANTFTYRSSASRPNDTLQAINYLHMLAKLMRNEPMFTDISLQQKLRNRLIGVPSLLSGTRRSRVISG